MQVEKMRPLQMPLDEVQARDFLDGRCDAVISEALRMSASGGGVDVEIRHPSGDLLDVVWLGSE